MDYPQIRSISINLPTSDITLPNLVTNPVPLIPVPLALIGILFYFFRHRATILSCLLSCGTFIQLIIFVFVRLALPLQRAEGVL